MLDFTLSTEQVNTLLSLLQNLQQGLLKGLDVLGLAAPVHGQPGWPFDQRIGAEMLRFDPGHARRVALALGALALLPGLLVLAALWRRGRWPLLTASALVLGLAPWPERSLLLSPAHPTSFHQARGGFTASSLMQGQVLYRAHCAQCHGADGGGEGPMARSLPMWPPNLNGPLLWQRLDGELFWGVLHGLQDRHGRRTMPGFQGTLDEGQVWAVLDYLQANAAGQSLRRTGLWANPVRAPELAVRCGDKPARPLSAWRGQRLRLVAASATATAPREDPRLVTAMVRSATVAVDDDCRIDGAGWDALALVAGVGPERLAGYQFLVDRDGWLRAVSRPEQSQWSDADLACSTSRPLRNTPQPADGLGALIARMDAEPVRVTRGGFPH
jgi:hypothetical protein